MSKPPFGFNVIAPLSANAGLGVSARHVVQLLLRRGYPVATFDLDPGAGRQGHDLTLARYNVSALDRLPYAINLLSLSIDRVADFFCAEGSALLDGIRLNVGLLYWELTVLPQRWIEALQLFDVILAPSRFIRSTFDSTLSGVRIVSAPYPMVLPPGILPSRSRFGLPMDKFLFVNSFDPISDPERKNTSALIEAFKRSCSKNLQTHLVIKVNSEGGRGPDQSFADKLAAWRRMPGVHIITEPLTYAEVLSLYASCDAFVSMHRSEGLGLGLMEAMLLGMPTIATGWSGNMTFMNHTNSCPLRYRLVPVQRGYPVYQKEFLGQQALWAEPDIGEATAWMRILVDQPLLRAAIGRKAADDMRQGQQEAERGEFIDEIQAIWEARSFLPARDSADYGQLLAKLRAPAPQRLPGRPTAAPPRKFKRLLDRHIMWRFHSR